MLLVHHVIYLNFLHVIDVKLELHEFILFVIIVEIQYQMNVEVVVLAKFTNIIVMKKRNYL